MSSALFEQTAEPDADEPAGRGLRASGLGASPLPSVAVTVLGGPVVTDTAPAVRLAEVQGPSVTAAPEPAAPVVDTVDAASHDLTAPLVSDTGPAAVGCPAAVGSPAAVASELSISYPGRRSVRRRLPGMRVGGRAASTVQAAVLLADAMAALLSVALVLLARERPWSRPIDLAAAGAIAALWPAAVAAQHGYRPRLGAVRPLDRRVLSAAVCVVAAVAALSSLSPTHPSDGLLRSLFIASAVAVVAVRAALRLVLAHRPGRSARVPRVVVVTSEASVESRSRQLQTVLGRPGPATRGAADADVASPRAAVSLIAAAVRGDEDVARVVATIAEQLPDLVVIDPAAFTPSGLQTLLWSLERASAQVVLLSGLFGVDADRLDVESVNGVPLVHVRRPVRSGPRYLLKAVAERCVAAVALIALLPLLLLLALLVRLTSRGPALFFQTRVGWHGQHFRMVKFRSMYADAERRRDELAAMNEAGDGLLFKIRTDPRVTPIGRVLRRCSLDELPQLWNVLTGSMSLVGPRPPLPSEVERYDDAVGRRLLVKPGLTGLWQVSGRSDLSWAESVRLDLYYVDNWSLSTDLSIVGRTISAVLRSTGAY